MKSLTFLLLIFISCNPLDEIHLQYNCYYEGEQKQILELINQYRNTKLVCDFDATQLAQERVIEIITDMSHDGYRTVNGQYPGEILSYGYSCPESIVKAFYNSENHCRVMLDDKYNRLGIGIYNKYTVIILIK